MNFSRGYAIANAVLYEGYLLYPYRRSSLKNERYWTLGGLLPEAYLHSECLLGVTEGGAVEWKARFLQVIGEGRVEREVSIGPVTLETLSASSIVRSFSFSPAVAGSMHVGAERLAGDLWKLTLRIVNEAATGGDESVLHAAHAIAGADSGQFISLIDPPAALKPIADACRNIGVWPVLAGKPPAADLLLCSPIILYDHPAIAPESPGDLFDSTEIDEILTLRILTLTDAERSELGTDQRARGMLERTEALAPEQRARLHGALRRLVRPGEQGVTELRAGDRVRLRPHRRADILDLALGGRAGRVASIEQDFEGRIHVAVTIEGDPGSDLGLAGRPGHRFFFHLDEVETIAKEELE